VYARVLRVFVVGHDGDCKAKPWRATASEVAEMLVQWRRAAGGAAAKDAGAKDLGANDFRRKRFSAQTIFGAKDLRCERSSA
ncbi:MAG TPA: hypothetical protein VII37_00860, partial [Candidatus Acidoferrum sp.]